MKQLFRALICLFLVAQFSPVCGQQISARAGVNFSTLLVKDNDETYSEDFGFLPGFQVGGTVLLPLTDQIFLETGLLLSTKGFREKSVTELRAGTLESVDTRTLNYIEIPATAKIFLDLGDQQAFAIFGPYVGLLASGKDRGKETFMGETEEFEGDLEIGNDEEDDDVTIFDFGVTAGVGLVFDRVQAGVAYSHGLANTSPYTDDGARINNRTISVFASYLINPE